MRNSRELNKFIDSHPRKFFLDNLALAEELLELKLARTEKPKKRKKATQKKQKPIVKKKRKSVIRAKGYEVDSPPFQTKSKRNKTGVIGVYYLENYSKSGRKYCFFVANWAPEKNKSKQVVFRATGFDDKVAFKKAKLLRKLKEKELKELKEQGLR